MCVLDNQTIMSAYWEDRPILWPKVIQLWLLSFIFHQLNQIKVWLLYHMSIISTKHAQTVKSGILQIWHLLCQSNQFTILGFYFTIRNIRKLEHWFLKTSQFKKVLGFYEPECVVCACVTHKLYLDNGCKSYHTTSKTLWHWMQERFSWHTKSARQWRVLIRADVWKGQLP